MAGTYESCYAFQSLEYCGNFLRGLARLDGFSIGNEKNRESFDLYAAKFESGAMRFWREKSLRRWNPFKTRIPPLSFYYMEQSTANSNSFKIAKPIHHR